MRRFLAPKNTTLLPCLKGFKERGLPSNIRSDNGVPFAVFAGQAVGIKEVHDDIWLVSFMDYDLGYFDLETRVLEPLDNPFGPRLLPMSPVRCVTHVSGLDPTSSGGPGWT